MSAGSSLELAAAGNRLEALPDWGVYSRASATAFHAIGWHGAANQHHQLGRASKRLDEMVRLPGPWTSSIPRRQPLVAVSGCAWQVRCAMHHTAGLSDYRRHCRPGSRFGSLGADVEEHVLRRVRTGHAKRLGVCSNSEVLDDVAALSHCTTRVSTSDGLDKKTDTGGDFKSKGWERRAMLFLGQRST